MRFPEFKEKWVKYRIDDIFNITRGNILSTSKISKVKSDINLYNVYSSQTINNGLLGYYSKFLFENAITWTTDGINAGTTLYRNGKFYCTNVCGVLLPKKFKPNKMIAENINKISKKYVTYVGNPKLMNKTMAKIEIFLPNIIEQEKISKLISMIDEKIETQMKIINNLETLIKGIRNKIFKISNNLDNNNRIKIKLENIMEEYSEKNSNNHKAISVGKYGLRDREELYSKELTNNYQKYKVIYKNTLVIGMGSNQIDIGILDRDEKYSVSPAYSTFKIKNINSSYLRELFIYINPEISKKYMIISARQGKAVDKKSLLNHSVFIHNIEIIKLITKQFNLIYDKTKVEKNLFNKYFFSFLYKLSILISKLSLS